MGHAKESAASQEFVEPTQPTGAAGFSWTNQGWVHGAVDGGIPSQQQVVATGLPEAHSACGKHGNGQASVVDLHHVDAITRAAPDGPFVDNGIGVVRLILDTESVEPDPLVGIGQDRPLVVHRARSMFACRSGGIADSLAVQGHRSNRRPEELKKPTIRFVDDVECRRGVGPPWEATAAHAA